MFQVVKQPLREILDIPRRVTRNLSQAASTFKRTDVTNFEYVLVFSNYSIENMH